MSLATILQAMVGGLLLGGVYALLSVGLTLIFGVMRVINFAQAEFMMVGMFATYVLVTFFNIDPFDPGDSDRLRPLRWWAGLGGRLVGTAAARRPQRATHPHARRFAGPAESCTYRLRPDATPGCPRLHQFAYWTPAGFSSTKRGCLPALRPCSSLSDFISF